MISVSLWLAGYALEFCLFVPLLWRLRRALVAPVAFTWLVTSLLLVIRLDWHLVWVIVPLLAFRLLNATRIFEGRMHAKYLHHAAFRTSSFLFAFHIVGIWAVIVLLRIPILLPTLVGQLLLSVIALATVLRAVRKLSFKMPEKYLADRDLPTVTVAIPARNETQDLEDCVRSVLASDYPKLEVLVLDDCSQGSRTAEIIRSFAHDGVRFIKGREPDDRWLAKNQAYEELYKNSSGKLMLFCGVDVRFGTGSIRAMVNLLHARQKEMISVLPLRVAGELTNTLFQPMRYWWELALPRRLFNRPPVLSTCWMITKESLHKMGGFAAVSRNITPERYFARELVKTDAYSFVRNSEDIDVRTQKSMTEQRATTVRLRYPQLHKRPENVFLLVLLEIYLFVGPLICLLGALAYGHYDLSFFLPLISLLLLLVTHLTILQMTNPANIGIAILTFPSAIVTEIAMNLYSMLKYEFGTVEWKDRNICIPVMHVIPHLPKLP